MMSTESPKTDPRTLMQLAKNGDAEAFGCLYQAYFVPIFRYIYFRVKDKNEAEDLSQNVFLKIYKSMPDFRDQNKSPLAYFFTVAKNAVIDYWRKKKEVPLDRAEKIPSVEKNPQKALENKEAGRAIEQAIGHLTDEQQEVVILKFINELGTREISVLLDKSEEAVRQIQCRALKTMRQYLKEDYAQ